MPFSSFLESAAGTCPFCNQKAGILCREHPDCRRTFQAGWNETVRRPAKRQNSSPRRTDLADGSRHRSGGLRSY